MVSVREKIHLLPVEEDGSDEVPPEVERLLDATLTSLRRQLSKLEFELDGLEIKERQRLLNIARNVDYPVPDQRADCRLPAPRLPDPRLPVLRARVKDMEHAVSVKVYRFRGGEAHWPATEYVSRFESGDFDYTHLNESVALARFLRSFQRAYPHLRPPTADLILTVGSQCTAGTIMSPMDNPEYRKYRLDAWRLLP